MTNDFDYSVPAGLYFSKRYGRKWGISFQRFDSAAAAIAFAVEELSPTSLDRTTLEVDEDRFGHGAIRGLYDSVDFPLARNVAAE